MGAIWVLLGLLVPAALIAALVLFTLRARAGEPFTVRLALLFRLYLYLMSLVSLMVMVFGLAFLLNAGFTPAFGKDFSYQAPPLYRPIEKATPPPAKGEGPEAAVPQGASNLEEQRANRDKELNRQFREGLINGIIMTALGGVVWVTHTVARRRMDAPLERKENLLNRAYVMVLLLIFGIGSIVGLTSGLSQAVKFAVAGDEYTYRSAPGNSLAIAIMFVPFWIYYLIAVFREVRQEGA